MFRLGIAIVVATALVGVFTASALGETQVCEPVDQSTKTVIAGVTLTWDSSFRCDSAPDEGDYEITITITNHSAVAVQVDKVQLSHTTPRPRGEGPEATVEASGLPLVISPGESGTVSVSGSYELVGTDEGMKANLHLRAVGWGSDGDEPFAVGINVHLRGAGAMEDGDGGVGGPPPWAGGQPRAVYRPGPHGAAHRASGKGFPVPAWGSRFRLPPGR